MPRQYEQNPVHPISQAASEASTIFLAKVFNWMAIGLGLTALMAFVVANSLTLLQIIFPEGRPGLLFYGLIIGELGMVIYLSARIGKISAGKATTMFLLYSALNGVTLSAILLLYTGSSIASTFVVAGGMFGAMAIYGTVTKKDLTSLGSFMFMGLFGLIIAGIVNMFLKSPAIDWITAAIGVIVFTGLTAYDVQKISRIGGGGIMQEGETSIRKGAIMGALALYLDFINLFLSLLRLMGDRR